jgi:hypothetical protein
VVEEPVHVIVIHQTFSISSTRMPVKVDDSIVAFNPV